MSRNLGRTTCRFCGGEMSLLEEPRLITPGEAGRYFDEYKRIRFATAECEDCEAPYLAWMEHGVLDDLSHYHSFNDEPLRADMPAWAIKRVAVRSPWKDTATTTDRYAPEDGGEE